MSEFLKLVSPLDAINELLNNIGDIQLLIKILPTAESLDRIVANDIRSPIASLWGSIIGTGFSGGRGNLSTTITPVAWMTGAH